MGVDRLEKNQVVGEFSTVSAIYPQIKASYPQKYCLDNKKSTM
jgi:hypothetical protein